MRDRYSFDERDGSGRLFVILVIVAFAFLAGWHLSKDEVPATVLEPEVVAAPLAHPEGVREAPALPESLARRRGYIALEGSSAPPTKQYSPETPESRKRSR
jgi:hypothetical protein